MALPNPLPISKAPSQEAEGSARVRDDDMAVRASGKAFSGEAVQGSPEFERRRKVVEATAQVMREHHATFAALAK